MNFVDGLQSVVVRFTDVTDYRFVPSYSLSRVTVAGQKLRTASFLKQTAEMRDTLNYYNWLMFYAACSKSDDVISVIAQFDNTDEEQTS